jgi:hypothetical protein
MRRSPLVAALSATAALAAAPSADARPLLSGAAATPCMIFIGGAPPGSVGTATQQCGALNFVGPAIGQVASVVGPTVISPAVTGAVLLTGNNVGGVP